MVAEVIINSTVKNLNKTFDYNIPAEIAGIIKVGDRILVPFGNAKELEEGFVVGFKEKSEYKVKDIVAIQEGFNLKEEQIELAKWMATSFLYNQIHYKNISLPSI